MKLKRFDTTTTVQAREQKPCLSVSAIGIWRANTALAAMLKLKKGTGVCLLQDEEEPTNWFIGVDKAHGFPVGEKGSGFQWNSRATKDELLASVDSEHPAGRMLVGEEATKHEGLTLYPILTSSLSYTPRKPRNA
jgi:hypothetical protein